MNFTREDLICIALLTGSDYTTGIRSIGPSMASEIIQKFPSFLGLKLFKEWIESIDTPIEPPVTVSKKLRNLAKKLDLRNFPDKEVYDAYMAPIVDEETKKFKFGVPDVTGIRSFMTSKTNWSESKVDEALIPAVIIIIE